MSKPRSTLVLPDVHCPWHSKVLWQKICKLARNERFDGLVLTGDFLDLYCLGSYNEGSLHKLRHWDLTKEYASGKEALDGLLDSIGRNCTDRHFIYGNHCARFHSYLETRDNSKTGAELRKPEEALQLRERKFKVHTNWKEDAVRLGRHLDVIHGIWTPPHAAKAHMDKLHGSVMFGHTHRFQCHTNGHQGSYNIGFLGDISSPGFHYKSRWERAEWRNGFAVVNVLDNGDFLPMPIQIHNDRFIFNRRLY